MVGFREDTQGEGSWHLQGPGSLHDRSRRRQANGSESSLEDAGMSATIRVQALPIERHG